MDVSYTRYANKGEASLTGCLSLLYLENRKIERRKIMGITETIVCPVEKIIPPFEVEIGDVLQAISIESRPHHGGVQYMFKFDNGYGASIIRTPYSYGGRNGLWELAVCKYYEFYDGWDLCYDTPITDDVIGYLKDEDVMGYLKRIKELQKGEY